MDPITIVGIVGGFVAIMVSAIWEGAHLSSLVHPAAALLIAGGTLGATAACFSMEEMMGLMRSTPQTLKKPSSHPKELYDAFSEMATVARREGVLALENLSTKYTNEFLRRGIQLLVDGTSPELLKDILTSSLVTEETKLKTQASIYAAAGGFAPTMGIIGTVIGLIHVLGNLSEPEKLGASIAGAFLATLYGIGLANLVLLPLGKKIGFRAHQEVELGLITIEGLISIQSGDNPRTVQQKILSLIPRAEHDHIGAVQAEDSEK
jgi:chemotaxis protein MotA